VSRYLSMADSFSSDTVDLGQDRATGRDAGRKAQYTRWPMRMSNRSSSTASSSTTARLSPRESITLCQVEQSIWPDSTSVFPPPTARGTQTAPKSSPAPGELRDGGHWTLRPGVTRELLAGRKPLQDLSDSDVTYEITQKGVDIKIGLDIASLAYKQQVERIVLISGDSDFVSAAKLARREGIDFILDPMWQPIRPGLFEHIDGLRSRCPRPPSP